MFEAFVWGLFYTFISNPKVLVKQILSSHPVLSLLVCFLAQQRKRCPLALITVPFGLMCAPICLRDNKCWVPAGDRVWTPPHLAFPPEGASRCCVAKSAFSCCVWKALGTAQGAGRWTVTWQSGGWSCTPPRQPGVGPELSTPPSWVCGGTQNHGHSWSQPPEQGERGVPVCSGAGRRRFCQPS